MFLGVRLYNETKAYDFLKNTVINFDFFGFVFCEHGVY